MNDDPNKTDPTTRRRRAKLSAEGETLATIDAMLEELDSAAQARVTAFLFQKHGPRVEGA